MHKCSFQNALQRTTEGHIVICMQLETFEKAQVDVSTTDTNYTNLLA